MTVEALKVPRWKVINPFPATRFKIGDIISALENGIVYMVEIDGISEKDSMNDYPHLFRRLEWHEERKVEDMPEYVKSCDGNIKFVLKVHKYILITNTLKFWAFEYFWQNEPDVKRMSLSGWLPATAEEYNQYIHKK